MRRLFVTLGGTLVFTLAGTFTGGLANATTLVGTSLRTATDSVSSVENTACWRRGWHGWGWYPCGGAVVVSVPAAPVVVAPAPAPVVVAPAPAPCYGHGWHRVCNGWGHCWRVCN